MLTATVCSSAGLHSSTGKTVDIIKDLTASLWSSWAVSMGTGPEPPVLFTAQHSETP